MPGGKSGLFPGIEKLHQSEEYTQWKAEEDLLREVGRDRLVELAQAEQDGRMVVLPCKVGDKVLIDARTLPYHYLHPADGCRDYAKCEIVSIVTTKKETYMKLRALYPSRANRREYLRYGVTAIGKTVFLTREEAEAALKGGAK